MTNEEIRSSESVKRRGKNPTDDLGRCKCSYNGLNHQIARAVTRAIDALVRIPKAVSILRNGGWELWLRNVLLIALEEETSCTGFSEIVIRSKGRKRGGKRADLFFECNQCQKVRFVAELKANFAKQGEQKAIAEFRGGVAQLARSHHTRYRRLCDSCHLCANREQPKQHIVQGAE